MTILSLTVLLAGPAQSQTLVIVRHAEKMEPWPAEDRFQPLSIEGMERAERLRSLVKDLDIKAIYTSNTTRTIATAMPAAVEKHLVPVPNAACENADSLDAFLDTVRSTYVASDFVLVVSHSNIIPEWLTRLRVDASTLTEMGISYNHRYRGYLVDGYDGVWIVSLPSETESAPHVRYATMSVR